MYDLEMGRVSDEIRKRGAKRVLLQLPDGLRPEAFKLVKLLKERIGTDFILLGDSCYGACDVALRQAEAVGADLIVHYGHTRMLPDADVPVVYVEARVGFNARVLIEKALPPMKGWRKIGLATTVQHVHQLGEVKEVLRRNGKEAVIGRGEGKTPYDGQVLGCYYRSAQSVSDDVDGFLFIGGGRFHPLGLAVATGKPVVAVDPYLVKVTSIGDEDVRKLAMQRVAAITAAKGAGRFGVLVSVKPGQFALSQAEELRDKLEAQGMEAVVICLDEVRPEALVNFSEADAFIDTACPRIALDGIADLRKPVLTMQEAKVLLGERRWEEIWGASYLG